VLFGAAKYLAPTATAAPVRFTVISFESITTSGNPVSPSYKTINPWNLAVPKSSGLRGKFPFTFTAVTRIYVRTFRGEGITFGMEPKRSLHQIDIFSELQKGSDIGAR
jgi:hypothetical protein